MREELLIAEDLMLLLSIFEEQVEKNPNNIALICDDVSLTYNELNEKANSLAHYLINKGIGRNDKVCIMTNRSLETIVCMIGISKAGAAFFNVDPTYPIERTKYYLEDSKTKYVLTQKSLRERVESIENCIEIDLSNDKIYGKIYSNPLLSAFCKCGFKLVIAFNNNLIASFWNCK